MIVLYISSVVALTTLWILFRMAWSGRRRRRAHHFGWQSARELEEWERKRTQDAEFFRQSKGG